jgi:outer membrane receptor protein involved in Fe transport
VDSYELGIKTKLLGNKLIFNVAAFRDEHKDIQLSIFTAAGAAASVVRNAAGRRAFRGLEFEAIARPADMLTINASLAFLDAKYKRYIDGGVDVSKNRAFPHAPKTTASSAWTSRWQKAIGASSTCLCRSQLCVVLLHLPLCAGDADHCLTRMPTTPSPTVARSSTCGRR